MSFLYSPARTAALRSTRPATRLAFSTTVQPRKSATDSVKDAAKKVDRTVANAAVAGIEKGRKFCCPSYCSYGTDNPCSTEELTGKAKEVAGVSSKKAEGSAAELAGEAKGTAAEMKGKAAGKAEEVKGKIT